MESSSFAHILPSRNLSTPNLSCLAFHIDMNSMRCLLDRCPKFLTELLGLFGFAKSEAAEPVTQAVL